VTATASEASLSSEPDSLSSPGATAPVDHGIRIASDTAIHLDGADGREAERGAAMARALWPVTWGYFLTELMKPVFETDDIQTAQRFFVNHVRGRGPYSAFGSAAHRMEYCRVESAELASGAAERCR
jgi:hypothetical protein